MNLTSTNIDNRLLLAKCCFADYAIKRLEKVNIGDNEQAKCYLSKMKQLYYSMQALNQFVPAAELAPYWTYYLISLFPSSFTGTRQVFIDGVAISEELSFTNATRPAQMVSIASNINTYQTDYIASFTSTSFTLTSVLSGTTNNGLEITASVDGATPVSFGVLAGGSDQWCLTDTQAKKILDNIDELCGCPCGDCDDILDDTLPRYIN